MSNHILINPAVMPAGKKIDRAAVTKTEKDPVGLIYTKTPILFWFRLKLFSLKRWMKWVLPKHRFTALGFFLNLWGQCTVSFCKFRGIEDFRHMRRMSFKLRRRLVFLSAISRSARSTLATNSELKKPKPAASRSNRSASSSTRTFSFRFIIGRIVRVSAFIKKWYHICSRLCKFFTTSKAVLFPFPSPVKI